MNSTTPSSSGKSDVSLLFSKRYVPLAAIIVSVVLVVFLSCYFGNSNYQDFIKSHKYECIGGAIGLIFTLAVAGGVILVIDRRRQLQNGGRNENPSKKESDKTKDSKTEKGRTNSNSSASEDSHDGGVTNKEPPLDNTKLDEEARIQIEEGPAQKPALEEERTRELQKAAELQREQMTKVEQKEKTAAQQEQRRVESQEKIVEKEKAELEVQQRKEAEEVAQRRLVVEKVQKEQAAKEAEEKHKAESKEKVKEKEKAEKERVLEEETRIELQKKEAELQREQTVKAEQLEKTAVREKEEKVKAELQKKVRIAKAKKQKILEEERTKAELQKAEELRKEQTVKAEQLEKTAARLEEEKHQAESQEKVKQAKVEAEKQRALEVARVAQLRKAEELQREQTAKKAPEKTAAQKKEEAELQEIFELQQRALLVEQEVRRNIGSWEKSDQELAIAACKGLLEKESGITAAEILKRLPSIVEEQRNALPSTGNKAFTSETEASKTAFHLASRTLSKAETNLEKSEKWARELASQGEVSDTRSRARFLTIVSDSMEQEDEFALAIEGEMIEILNESGLSWNYETQLEPNIKETYKELCLALPNQTCKVSNIRHALILAHIRYKMKMAEEKMPFSFMASFSKDWFDKELAPAWGAFQRHLERIKVQAVND